MAIYSITSELANISMVDPRLIPAFYSEIIGQPVTIGLDDQEQYKIVEVDLTYKRCVLVSGKHPNVRTSIKMENLYRTNEEGIL